ncbi:MAG TPA: hypothetical protein VKH35_14000 [Thermoanaerobaculia bacterium]|nr:hypothetical protein [Thermoanaerobaculia bacterium]
MGHLNETRCRLCGAIVLLRDLHRSLCPVCDEWAQHIALQTNRGLETVVGDLQNGAVFRAASRESH